MEIFKKARKQLEAEIAGLQEARKVSIAGSFNAALLEYGLQLTQLKFDILTELEEGTKGLDGLRATKTDSDQNVATTSSDVGSNPTVSTKGD